MMQTSTGFQVHEVRWVSDSTFVLRFDRRDLPFCPGQYVSVGPAGDIHMREYSVYSSPAMPYLEVLVKLVEDGYVSRKLAALDPGSPIAVDGPFGFFTIDEDWREHRFSFIATGTGISPFHCFAGTYPELNYTLLHGVRTAAEAYEYDAYDRRRVITCTSRDTTGDYHGRVTSYLREHPIDPTTRYYLCGNCDMIYEAFDILQDAGVPHGQLFAEVYF